MSHSRSMLVIASASIAHGPVLAAQGPGASFHPIILRDPRLVTDAASLNVAINAALGTPHMCPKQDIETGLRCGCGGKDNLGKLGTAYREIAARHPRWDRPKVIVSYANPAKGHWVSLNLQAVNRMLTDCAQR